MKLCLLACMLTIGSLAACGVASAEDPPVFQLKWGSPGSGSGQFRFARDLTADGAGNIYVADTENQRVQRFSKDGAYLGELDSAPSGPAAFGNTLSCAVDGAGNLYVMDARGFIDVFDATQTFVRSWPASVKYLALDPTGQYLYATVADSIVKYDVATGGHLRAWVYSVPSPNYYTFAVGPSGNVYISGMNDGDFVAKYTPDGNLLKAWGGTGTGNGQFNGSRGVAVDATENVYVGDGNGRVQKFNAEGSFLSAWGSLGTGDGQFTRDTFALTTDSAGHVLVFDYDLQRIQKFVYGITAVRTSTWGALKDLYR